MAIKGAKRTSAAAEINEVKEAKKKCQGIVQVLKAGAGNMPGAMLASLAPKALLTFKEERHPLEANAAICGGSPHCRAQSEEDRFVQPRD